MYHPAFGELSIWYAFVLALFLWSVGALYPLILKCFFGKADKKAFLLFSIILYITIVITYLIPYRSWFEPARVLFTCALFYLCFRTAAPGLCGKVIVMGLFSIFAFSGFEETLVVLMMPDYILNPHITGFIILSAVQISHYVGFIFLFAWLWKKKIARITAPKLRRFLLPALILAFFFFASWSNSYVEKMIAFGGQDSLLLAVHGTYVTFFTLLVTYALFINDTLKRKSDELQRYQALLEKQYETISEFRHDYKNMLYVLSGMSDARQYDELNAYLHSTANEGKSILDENYVTGLKDIGSDGLKALLIGKLFKAQQACVKLSIISAVKENTKFPAGRAFFELIGILIDNAVEASACADKKLVELTIESRRPEQEGETTELSIRIENTFDTSPDLNHIFQKDYTTKQGHSGIGLHRAQKLISAKDAWQFSCEIIESRFVVILRV